MRQAGYIWREGVLPEVLCGLAGLAPGVRREWVYGKDTIHPFWDAANSRTRLVPSSSAGAGLL